MLSHTTARLVQMRAVVELTVPQMLRQIWHQARELCGLDVMQAEFLEAGAVDQGGLFFLIEPIQRGRSGGVFAGIERLRNLLCLHKLALPLPEFFLRLRREQIDQRAFAYAAWAEHERGFAMQASQKRGLIGIAR